MKNWNKCYFGKRKPFLNSILEATFRHLHGLIERIPIQAEVQTLILSLGLNQKQQLQTAIKEVQQLHKVAQVKFPNAQIVFPINYSNNLPQ